MFNSNLSGETSAWFYWFMGVMVVYALLWLFPSTEQFAAKAGAVLGAIGVFLFWRSIIKWLRGG